MDVMTPELEAFRTEVRGWINSNFPEDLRAEDKQEEYYQLLPRYPEGELFQEWKQKVVAKGWGTPGWPTEHGGAGLPTEEARIVNRELYDCGAFNPMTGMGTTMLGPTLLEYGTDEQKTTHLNRKSS